MEQTILANFNKMIKPNDVLFLLGDVCLGKKAAWERFLNALPTKNIILLKGNHDRWQSIPKDLVLTVMDSSRLQMCGMTFVLSHYPYRAGFFRALWKRLHPAVREKRRPKDTGLWLLHGHDHRKTILCDYHPRQINVGVDANNFRPISGEEIIRIVQKQASKSTSSCMMSLFCNHSKKILFSFLSI